MMSGQYAAIAKDELPASRLAVGDPACCLEKFAIVDPAAKRAVESFPREASLSRRRNR